MADGSAKTKRVLVVDDAASDLMLSTARLRMAGFEVVSAQAGVNFTDRATLQALIASESPDIVLTDYNMRLVNNLTGFDTLAAAHAVNPALPVVLHSTELQEVPNPEQFNAVYSKRDTNRFTAIANLVRESSILRSM